MSANSPFVSILTPVHNGEKYLRACIESVLSQTYGNWEYIIVNNFSTDGSHEIIDEYVKKDQRIRLFETDVLHPAFNNWNQMLRKISPQSKYCKIVHADDWMFPECVEKMVALAEQHPSVGIVGSYRLQGEQVVPYDIPYGSRVVSGSSRAREFLHGGQYTFGSPTALLVRSDLVRKDENFYNEAHDGADTAACLRLLQHCDYGFIPQVLTFGRIHDESRSFRINEMCMDIFVFLSLYKKFGRVFLEPAEYETGLKAIMVKYYRILARRITSRNHKEFWNYHRQSLASLGSQLSWLRIFKSALSLLFWRVVDTKRNLLDLRAWVQRLRGAT